jgi:hypothetical protein
MGKSKSIGVRDGILISIEELYTTDGEYHIRKEILQNIGLEGNRTELAQYAYHFKKLEEAGMVDMKMVNGRTIAYAPINSVKPVEDVITLDSIDELFKSLETVLDKVVLITKTMKEKEEDRKLELERTKMDNEYLKASNAQYRENTLRLQNKLNEIRMLNYKII